jgi:hypothetical protein
MRPNQTFMRLDRHAARGYCWASARLQDLLSVGRTGSFHQDALDAIARTLQGSVAEVKLDLVHCGRARDPEW